MNLNAPKQITFWISVLLVIIGIVLSFIAGAWAWWLVVAGFILLAIGCLFDGI